MTQFKILGALEVVHKGRSITPSPPKVQRVLALLLVRGNHLVHPESIASELWGERPPKSAATTVQTYIYQLRRMFKAEGIDEAGECLIATRLPGYVLRVEQDALDADIFDRLVDEGSKSLETGHPERATDLLDEALKKWSGPVLGNVPLGRALEAYSTRLEERRINALQMRMRANMEMNRHKEIIGELRSLVASFPLDEVFHGQLIQALAHSGRRGDALRAYQDVREILQEELGLDPSPDLQRLQRLILT